MKTIILIIMLLLLSTIATAQTTEEVNPGITPDSPLWGLERAFERIQEVFNKQSKERHALERIAEAKQMIQENKAEHAQKALEKAREKIQNQELTQVQNQYKEKFKVTEEVLNEVKGRINKELDSEIARENLEQNTKVLFILKNYDDTIQYYSITIEEGQITLIEEKENNEGDYTFQIALSHGEFYALQKMSSAGLANQFRKIESYGERHKYQYQERNQEQIKEQNKKRGGVE